MTLPTLRLVGSAAAALRARIARAARRLGLRGPSLAELRRMARDLAGEPQPLGGEASALEDRVTPGRDDDHGQ